jgi:hypothetical protein
MLVPSNINVINGGCSVFNDLNAANGYAQDLLQTLKLSGYKNVSIKVTGNILPGVASNDGGNSENYCNTGRTSYTVCSEYDDPISGYDDCPAIGAFCYASNYQNNTIPCEEHNPVGTTRLSTRTCYPDGPYDSKGSADGKFGL